LKKKKRMQTPEPTHGHRRQGIPPLARRLVAVRKHLRIRCARPEHASGQDPKNPKNPISFVVD
jgi:hypothetical protein